MSRITVAGGGNGAFAVAADLALEGHEVSLFELPDFEKGIEAIGNAGGIYLESIPSSGRKSGFAKLADITADAGKALRNAEVVFVVVPAYAQRFMAEACAPHLKKEQVVCLMPGNAHGSIDFLRTLRRVGNTEVQAVAELECLIYTATRKEEGVGIRGFKHGLGMGVFPSRLTEKVAPVLEKLYPGLTVRKNVLATGVSNPNVLLHVPLVLLNCANVERGLDMLSFHAAFTSGVARLVDALDDERMELSRMGLADIMTVNEMVRAWYSAQGASGSTTYEVMSTNPLYFASKLPKTTEHRYFTEDIPYGVCPISELLGICGASNRLFAAVADLGGAALGKNFYAEARTLASMGLNLDAEQLISYVCEGE